MSLTAQEIAGIAANGTSPAAGDTIAGLLAKVVELLGGVDHYLGTHTYSFAANEAGSLGTLLEAELAAWPTTRQVAIFNSGGSAQTINGSSINAGDAVTLTLAQAVGGTYDVSSAGAETLEAFFIA